MTLQTTTISGLMAKFCHDLIGPLGTMQMALEAKNPDLLSRVIQDAIQKVDVFRCIYSTQIKKEIAKHSLQKYIDANALNLKMNDAELHTLPLLFFLSQKMLPKSTVVCEKNTVHLECIMLTQNEIEALTKNQLDDISAENIVPHMANIYLKENKFTIDIAHLGEKNWTMKIKKIIN